MACVHFGNRNSLALFFVHLLKEPLIDWSSFTEDGEAKKAFKRHILAKVGIPYLCLPEDESELMQEEKWLTLIEQISRLDAEHH